MYIPETKVIHICAPKCVANTPKYIKMVYFLLSLELSSSSTAGATGLVTRFGHNILRTKVATIKATRCAGCVVRVNTLEGEEERKVFGD